MNEREERTDASNKGAKQDHSTVIVKVNGVDVTLNDHRVAGVEIKQAAIAQGVPHVTLEFLLMLVGKDGDVQSVADDKVITVNKHSEFRMVSPDDNSEY